MDTIKNDIEQWIAEHFSGEDVTIEEFPYLPHGKKINEPLKNDYVIVYYHAHYDRVNFYFKPN
ncbi:hypothetical protein RGU11_11390 [Rossellomorea marisflavi]|jgi:hypothetical protein|uniref:hypothetical protein n=1 Tax=Rossellomorea marisflavi TaxID=189381 RepID=UPI0028534555|nr:hypothetical protein [Rossellomorea marisflavi]MDR4936984.1 hypothetical protein [Rossellomorea marisflavi]